MTPSETEVLKMFDEIILRHHGNRTDMQPTPKLKELKDFLLTQLRLACADKRKQAYEEGRNAAYQHSLILIGDALQDVENESDSDVINSAVSKIESARKA